MVILALSLIISLRECKAQVIIGNSSITEDCISKNTLSAIFGMRLHTWPDGTPIKVFVLQDKHPLHIKFAKRRLNIFPHQLRWCWDRLVFSGTGQAPTELSSEDEMRKKVASVPGAIGYLEGPVNDKHIKTFQIK